MFPEAFRTQQARESRHSWILTVVFVLSILISWLVRRISEFGSFGTLLPLLFLAAPFLIRRQTLRQGLRELDPGGRMLLGVWGVFALMAQIVHPFSLRTHRDFLTSALFMAVWLSAGSWASLFGAMRRILVFVLVFMALAQFFPESSYWMDRLAVPFHPNHTAILLLMLLPAMAVTGSWRNPVDYLIVALTLAGVALTQSRTAFAVLVVYGVLAIWWCWPRFFPSRKHASAAPRLGSGFGWGKGRVPPALASASLIFVAFAARSLLGTRILNSPEIWNFSGRFSIWPLYMDRMGSSPFFGLGDHGLYSLWRRGIGYEVVSHPHNIIFYLAVTHGFVVAGLFLMLLIYAGVRLGRGLIKARQRPPSEGLPVLAAAAPFFAGVVFAITEVQLFSTVWGGVFWASLLAGLSSKLVYMPAPEFPGVLNAPISKNKIIQNHQ